MKAKYVLGLTSRSHLPLEVIREILAGELVHQLVFPAVSHLNDLTTEEWRRIERAGSHEGFEHRFRTIPVQSVETLDPCLITRDFPTSASISLNFGQNNGGELWIYLSLSESSRNTFSLHFPEEIYQSSALGASYCLSVFDELLPKFKPYSGDILQSGTFGTHTLSLKTYDEAGICKESYTLELHWITFYGNELLARIGRERIERLRGFASRFEEREDGIIVCLVDEMFDADNPDHMAKLEEARRIVNFEEIATEIYSREIEVIG